jgi:hypothetical protein
LICRALLHISLNSFDDVLCYEQAAYGKV